MSTGAAKRRTIDEVTNVLNAVVTGGVEFDDVVAGAGFNGKAGSARTTWLAVDR
jgi:hypothetical protein